MGCAKVGGTVGSEFLTTETTNAEDKLGPLHGIPLKPAPLSPGGRKTLTPVPRGCEMQQLVS